MEFILLLCKMVFKSIWYWFLKVFGISRYFYGYNYLFSSLKMKIRL